MPLRCNSPGNLLFSEFLLEKFVFSMKRLEKKLIDNFPARFGESKAAVTFLIELLHSMNLALRVSPFA